MRISGVAALALVLATGAQAQAQAQTPDADAFFNRFRAGDCTSYEALAGRVLAPKGDLKDAAPFLAVSVGGCAARAGRLDIAERLGEQFVTARPVYSDDHLSVLVRRYGIIVSDVPGGGPVAARALDRFMAVLPPDRAARLSLGETHATALFAAGRAEEGRALYADAFWADLLSIQVDRRFEPLWASVEGLEAAQRARQPEPEPPADADWSRRFFWAAHAGRDEEAVAVARRQIEIETVAPEDSPRIYRERGWSARQSLVIHLVEMGQVEAALAALEAGAADGDADYALDYRRTALMVLTPALLRADRSADARRLLDAELAVGRERAVELTSLADYRDCLAGGQAVAAGTRSWKIALDCGAPQDQVAGLLLRALADPERRRDVLLAVNLAPTTPVFGRRDAAYRQERAALFARPDVKAAVERHGRVLPADLARSLMGGRQITYKAN